MLPILPPIVAKILVLEWYPEVDFRFNPVSDTQLQLSPVLFPCLALTLWLPKSKFAPFNVIDNEPVDKELVGFIFVSWPISWELTCVAVPTCAPIVTSALVVPMRPPLDLHLRAVSANQLELSAAEFKTLTEVLEEELENPQPCKVTLLEPVVKRLILVLVWLKVWPAFDVCMLGC